ncbi:MAG TPA: hypothetical protein VFR23_11645 [Jiangellaceae bacterium]|nr:hypothetical protein [Jiangellaceae bacterium]
MNLGVTRIEATQTKPILDDFRAGCRGAASATTKPTDAASY